MEHRDGGLGGERGPRFLDAPRTQDLTETDLERRELAEFALAEGRFGVDDRLASPRPRSALVGEERSRALERPTDELDRGGVGRRVDANLIGTACANGFGLFGKGAFRGRPCFGGV